jgi:hypothetical protein
MFIEPTRRLTFAPPFTYDARYGASLVAVLLGTYLLLNSNVSQIAVALSGLAAMPQTVTALLVSQLVFAALVLLAGILIHPATPARRLAAGAVVLVGLILWVVISGARVTGTVRLPPLSMVIFAPSFAITLLAVAAWLIVRERHGASYLLLILTLAGGFIPYALVMSGVDSGTNGLAVTPIAAVLGVGIAWLARAITAGLSHGVATAPVPPAA